MIAKQIFYAFCRIYELGFIGVYKTIQRRIFKKIWRYSMSNKAKKFKAHTNWEKLSLNEKNDFINCSKNIEEEKYIEKILTNKLFTARLPLNIVDQVTLQKDATRLSQHIFDLLGSGPVTLDKTIPWHEEFKKNTIAHPFKSIDQSFTYSKYAHTFHLDIPIQSKSKNFSTYHEDIKILWDLARMHHLSLLGLAHSKEPNKLYIQTFEHDIKSFQKQVNFLLGPHWKCPMDVSIRAINLIWALHFFNSSIDRESFWQDYICMLYDHMTYLLWNMEESDKPNNHLLADHVGLLYLAVFFKKLPNGNNALNQVIKNLEKAFYQQVFPDGTAYEGSTAYHRLDCELLLHSTLLLESINKPSPKLSQLLSKMLQFYDMCAPTQKSFITIGDDDSGSIVFGIQAIPQKSEYSSHTLFKNFGIGFITSPQIHCSLRSTTHGSQYPTGHYHHDTLGITLSINGYEVFVDPASFIYTGNTLWRNFFKAPQQHSTFFLNSEIMPDKDLFQTKHLFLDGTLNATNNNRLQATARRCDNLGVQHRAVSLSGNTLTVNDSLLKMKPNSLVTWRFILHPNIEIEKIPTGFAITTNSIKLAHIESTFPLIIKNDAAYAPLYGTFCNTKALEGEAKTPFEPDYITTIKILSI